MNNVWNKALYLFIGLIIVLYLASALIPQTQSSLSQFNASTTCSNLGGFYNLTNSTCYASATDSNNRVNIDYPLRGLFTQNGLVMLLLMVGLFVLAIYLAMRNANSGK